ncbi:MAG: serine/threonine protein kinase, partial [Gemmataceae bacterium]|nr:serine/threonine protein kinase [Gemmataceae bacterium]
MNDPSTTPPARSAPSLATAEHLPPADTRDPDPTTGATPTAPDPDATTGPDPATRPPDEDAPPAPPGYELREQVGRGGMGVVFRARDLDLSRSVAVKFLRARYPADGLHARRFVEEARVTGRLQHPGVPPVHRVGALADGRPYLVMKLIHGRTLADLLADQARPDTGRFVGVFEQICQAVGFAHSKGIVHRDLKPANVMVGDFGEVQVMDWGLAKLLATAPPDAPGEPAPALRDPCDETQAGSVMGTPAFMPPEQARGEIDRLDARTDVFGLGAVLCAVLTGKPPFVGQTGEVLQLAGKGQLGDAFARLDGCGAEPELVALCKRCLAPDPSDRPADGYAVAAAVSALRLAADDRARRAELERVRATEQRKRARVQLALVGAVLLLAVGGGGVGWYLDRQATEQRARDDREAADRRATEARLAGERDAVERVKREQAEQGVGRALGLAAALRGQAKFREAEAALAQARELAAGGAPELAPAVV